MANVIKAYMRKWAFDGIKPYKELNKNGRMAWPMMFKLMSVTEHQCLSDDVPLYSELPSNNKKYEWLPIAKYDALKKKPDNCVFLFAPVPHERGYLRLATMVGTGRTAGCRDCTHYFVLPPFPEFIEEAK